MRQEFRCLFCSTVIPWKGIASSHKFCNTQCCGNWKKQQWFDTNRKDFENGTMKARAGIKKFVVERDGYTCAICSQLPFHNEQPLIMILDHIDGDASNNKPTNFRLVCPNCDTQLPTYKAKNIGNGRATKGMPCYSRL
jgi:hypothetical protein